MKNKVRFLSLLTVIVLSILSLTAFTACGKNNSDDNKLYVGMECGYIPFNYTQLDDSNGAVKISNADGYANGYDVMIAKKIAESLNKELVIVKYEFNALVNAVKTGVLDFIIAGMSPTAERKEEIDFSDAYYESQLVIVVRADSKYANVTSLSDFNGANIVAQVGTFHDLALESQASTYGIKRGTPMKDFPAMTVALTAGAIDGYVAEEPGAIADCASVSGLTYVHLVNNSTGFTASAEDVQIAVGLKKGSDLTAQVNAALANISQEERQQMIERAISLSPGSNIEE